MAELLYKSSYFSGFPPIHDLAEYVIFKHLREAEVVHFCKKRIELLNSQLFFVPCQKGSEFSPLAVLYFHVWVPKATHCTQVLFRLEGSVVEKPSGRVESSFREKKIFSC